jgi:hypothetical protein
MRKGVGARLLAGVLVCSMLLLLTGGLIRPGSARAASIHPLLDDYANMKASYPFINNLLNTGKANDTQIRAWIGDVEDLLSSEIVSQYSAFDSARLTDVAAATFSIDFSLSATQNTEVFEALKAAYGLQIYDSIRSGQLPPDVQQFLSHIKDILIRSMVIASPSPGSYSAPLTVRLSGFTGGASFFYTLDGTNPTPASNPYGGGITINTTGQVVLKAIASKGGNTSDVSAFNYTVTGGGGGGGPAAPTQALVVQTASWDLIDTTYATLYGRVAGNGTGQPLTEYGFYYGTATLDAQNGGTKVVAGTGDKAAPFDFSAKLNDLEPDTGYYFKAYAATSQGVVYGEALTFKTPQPPPVQPPAQPPAREFPDVPAGYWGGDQIGQLVQAGIMTGYPDGNFYPDRQITRAELARIVARAFNLADHQPGSSTFGDVHLSDWYYGSVEAAVYAGILKGRGHGDFEPNAPVTREELAVIVVRALGEADEAATTATTSFTDDASISAWARGFVVVAGQQGLVGGYPEDNSFRPRNGATRAEVCTIVSRLLSLK